jgi:hypothetical protein
VCAVGRGEGVDMLHTGGSCEFMVHSVIRLIVLMRIFASVLNALRTSTPSQIAKVKSVMSLYAVDTEFK